MKWYWLFSVVLLVSVPAGIHRPPEEWGKPLDGQRFRTIMEAYGYTQPGGASDWETVLHHRWNHGRITGKPLSELHNTPRLHRQRFDFGKALDLDRAGSFLDLR